MALTAGEFERTDAGNGYSYAYKIDASGNAGVNFYYQGQPIPGEQFTDGTGEDWQDVEGMAQATVPDMLEIGNRGTEPNTPEQQAQIDSGIYYEDVFADKTEEPTAPATGGTGDSTAFEPRWFDGPDGPKLYSDEESYTKAVNDKINANFEEGKKNAQTMYNNGLIDLDTMEQNIRDTRVSLTKQRDTALQGTSAYFNRISPDAIQSQQKTYGNKVNENFEQANTRLGTELEPGGYRNADSNVAGELSDVGRLSRGFTSLGEAKTGADAQAQANKSSDTVAFQNQLLGDKATDSVTPSYATPTASDYSDVKSYYDNYLGNFNGTSGGFSNQPASVTDEAEEEYWNK